MGYKRKEQDRNKERNFVAKHAHKFNSHKVHADRKLREKRGYVKHKGEHYA